MDTRADMIRRAFIDSLEPLRMATLTNAEGELQVSDIFPAVCVAAVGRYGAVVRDIHNGAIAYCDHVHKRRSTALRCAELLMRNMT